MRSRCAWLLCSAFSWLVLPAAGSAQAGSGAERFRIRLTPAAGTLVSEDQIGRMGFDQVGLLFDAAVVYDLFPSLAIEAGAWGGTFLASKRPDGGLTAPLAGVLVTVNHQGLRPYAHLDLGAGMTGALLRPLVRAGLGVDISLSRAISVGPVAGYGHVFQTNVTGASSDARMIWFGLSLFYRPVWSSGPSLEVRERIRDRVTVVERQGPPAEPTPPSEELLKLIEQTVPSDPTRIELLAPVLFELDSDALAPLGVAMLHEVERTLNERTEIKLLEIEGYADARGNPAYNIELSQRRAERVRQWLIEHGIAAERLRVAAHGEAKPVERDQTDAAFEQNRRVVFRVVEQDAP